jgi:hypothetical protein
MNVQGVNGLAPLLLADLTADGRISGGEIISFRQTKGVPPVLDPDGKAARLMFELGENDFPHSNALLADGRIKRGFGQQNDSMEKENIIHKEDKDDE